MVPALHDGANLPVGPPALPGLGAVDVAVLLEGGIDGPAGRKDLAQADGAVDIVLPQDAGEHDAGQQYVDQPASRAGPDVDIGQKQLQDHDEPGQHPHRAVPPPAQGPAGHAGQGRHAFLIDLRLNDEHSETSQKTPRAEPAQGDRITAVPPEFPREGTLCLL